MATAVYRFRNQAIQASRLARFLAPGANPIVGSAATPAYQDITVDTTHLTDLQEYMATLGYTLDSTNPVTTPTEQAAAALGVSGSSTKYWIDEDFISGNFDQDELGKHGFRVTTSGTGADCYLLPAETGRNGIVRVEGGTAAAGKSAVHLGDSVVGGQFMLAGTQGQWDGYWDVRPIGSILATGTQLFQCGWGQEWTLVDELLNGLYVRYLPGTDTTWTMVSAIAGVRTTRAGTTAPSLTTWARVGIRVTYPGGVPTAQLVVNGVAEGSTMTGLPTFAMGWGAKIDGISSPVTEGMVDLDRTELKQAA